MSYKNISIYIMLLFLCTLILFNCGGGSSSSSTSISSTTISAYIEIPGESDKDLAPKLKGAPKYSNPDNHSGSVTIYLSNGNKQSTIYSGNGDYEFSVNNLSNVDGFVIEAVKGSAEVKNFYTDIITSSGNTYNAGIVDTETTLVTEMVIEISDNEETAADLSNSFNFIKKIRDIKNKIDIVEIKSNIQENAEEYSNLRTKMERVIQAMDADDTTATKTVFQKLKEGNTVNGITRTEIKQYIQNIVLPAFSSVKSEIRTAANNLMQSYMLEDASAAAAILSDSLIWHGKTKSTILTEWQKEWDTGWMKFNGEIVIETISPSSGVAYSRGLQSFWFRSTGYSDGYVSYRKWNDRKAQEPLYFVKESDGIWRARGDLVKIGDATAHVHIQKKYDVNGLLLDKYIKLEMVSRKLSDYPVSNISMKRYHTGILSQTHSLTANDSYWVISSNIGLDSITVGDTCQVVVLFSDSSTATYEKKIKYVPSENIPVLVSPDVSDSVLTSIGNYVKFQWTDFRKTAKNDMAGVDFILYDNNDNKILEQNGIFISLTYVVIPATVLTSGNQYAVQVKYTDLFKNEYSVKKNFTYLNLASIQQFLTTAPKIADTENTGVHTFKISWEKLAVADSYNLILSSTSDFSGSTVTYVTADTYYSFTDFDTGTYYYKVCGIKSVPVIDITTGVTHSSQDIKGTYSTVQQLEINWKGTIVGKTVPYNIKKIEIIREYAKSVSLWGTKHLLTGKLDSTDNLWDVNYINLEKTSTYDVTLTSGQPTLLPEHNGNASWHPSGEFIVFTGAKLGAVSADSINSIPGRGGYHDLYVMDKTGSYFWKVYATHEIGSGTYYPAIIHPQFSTSGESITWAERVGKDSDTTHKWGQWCLKIGDFNYTPGIGCSVTNVRGVQRGEQHQFYETHDFSKDDKHILFSGNLKESQPPVGMDIYRYDIATDTVVRLTDSFMDWDEHAHYTHDGTKIAWMSSKEFDIEWVHGYDLWQEDIITELWLMDSDGSNRERLTYFNEDSHPHRISLGTEFSNAKRIMVSDSEWGPNDDRLIFAILIDLPGQGLTHWRLAQIEFK